MQKQYDIQTLMAYLAGKLDARAMHELEKQALEDPLLSEALEGLRENNEVSEPDLEQTMQRLSDRLDQRVAQSEPVTGPEQDGDIADAAINLPLTSINAHKTNLNKRRLWAAAAAIFFLLSGGLLYFVLQRGDATKKGTPATEVVALGNKDNVQRPSVADSGLDTATDVAKAVAQALSDHQNELADSEPADQSKEIAKAQTTIRATPKSPALITERSAHLPEPGANPARNPAADLAGTVNSLKPADISAGQLIHDSLLRTPLPNPGQLATALQGKVAGIAISRENASVLSPKKKPASMEKALRPAAAYNAQSDQDIHAMPSERMAVGPTDSAADALAEVVIVGYGNSGKRLSARSKLKAQAHEIRLRGVRPVSDSLSPGKDGQPLYVIDGRLLNSGEFENLSPNSIESVSVLSPEKAPAIYGDKGKYGAVLVTTKAGSRLARVRGAGLNRKLMDKKNEQTKVRVSRLSGHLRPVAGFAAFKKSLSEQLDTDLSGGVISLRDKGSLIFELRLTDKGNNRVDIFNIRAKNPNLIQWFKSALTKQENWYQWQPESPADNSANATSEATEKPGPTKIKISLLE